MGRRANLFWKANKFPIEVSMNYLRFATKAEKTFDFLIPAILTVIIMLFIAYMNPNTTTILKGIKDINNQSLTFISILAGFNIASISVLATAGSKLLEDLRKTKSNTVPDKTLFEIMLTFFCAAIIIQFIIILVGVIILIVSSITDFSPNFHINKFIWCMISFWIYALITTIFISIRNLKTLFYIMIYEEH
ncbi:hypothetical protein [Bacillus thuringiensis]|uniref:hypothetical protein n=1 Tax=Bacillus cereus group TaxID=86661 RepID=UPI0020D262A0|nr:hypothetical protein [Bacillus thuringiensis]MED0991943.1 hypothetical protein [Bacillus nitratireducens]